MNFLIADDEKTAATSLARSVKKVLGEDAHRHLDRGDHPEGMTPHDSLPRYEWAEFFHGRRDE